MSATFLRIFEGRWKRHLSWYEFSPGFRPVKESNSVVVVEECDGGGDIGSSGSRFLKWSFGTGLNSGSLRTGYIMKVVPGPEGSFLEWKHREVPCHGMFNEAASVAILNFFVGSR